MHGLALPKLLIYAALAWGAWIGYQALQNRMGGGAAGRASQLATLAASTSASDVLFYSAPWCPHCAAARSWMKQYGFKFEECDIEASPDCADQLKRLSADGGVPYLIVKGQHMKDGFDSDAFIAALQR